MIDHFDAVYVLSRELGRRDAMAAEDAQLSKARPGDDLALDDLKSSQVKSMEKSLSFLMSTDELISQEILERMSQEVREQSKLAYLKSN